MDSIPHRDTIKYNSKIDTKYRKIVTSIPTPESLKIIKSLAQYESRSMHGQYPIVWDKAEGFQVYDNSGNKWLDFTSTIFVANAGHGNSKITSKLKKVLDKPLLHTYTYYSQERANYIEFLIKNTPSQFEKAFLVSAGTEATECALKLMRMSGYKKNKKKSVIISFEGNWHGRTLGAQMMSSNEKQKEWIGYHDPNIYYLPFPHPLNEDAQRNPEQFFLTEINNLIAKHNINPEKDICGFMVEAYQGWGAFFYPKQFIKALEKFARRYSILITFDEIQSGFGRTGKLFGYIHYEVNPDLICCGKGASSSLPLAMVLGSKEIMDLPEIGSMSSTHSANPMACVAGHANFEFILKEKLIEKTDLLGKIFITELNKIKALFPQYINLISGKGLVAAIHFKDPFGKPLTQLCNQVCNALMLNGLLVVNTGREAIKLAPPLIISKEALYEGLEVIKEVIHECTILSTDSSCD